MSEIGEASELVDELVMEAANEGAPGHSAPRWHRQVGLSSLILALLAALGGLLAGMTAHESLLERTREVIAVSQVEGARARIEVLRAKHEILAGLGQAIDPDEVAQIEAFETEAEEILVEAALGEFEVQMTGYAHLVLALAVTVLSVGITLSGMAVVVDEKWLWIGGMATGGVGAVGLALGIVVMLA